jgi:2'-5' RNA ligase
MNKLRAFIAFEMPSQVKDVVRECQKTLRKAGVQLRWVKPENVHLTLRFLGDIPAEAVGGIGHVLRHMAEETPAFSLRVKGAGVFPGLARPRVLWLGLDGQKQLLEAAWKRLSGYLSRLDIPGEKRPFKGHLTIGRTKGRLDTELFGRQLDRLAALETQPFQADRLCLFKSDLEPDGAIYTPLIQVRTGGRNITGEHKGLT